MSGRSSSSRISGPEWPTVPAGRRIIFLVESASRVERRLIDAWIEADRPEESGAGSYEVVQIPCPRRRGGSRWSQKPQIPDPALEAALATSISTGGDPLMAPLRVVWLAPLRNGSRDASVLELLLTGDPRDPNWLRQSIVARREPDRCLLIAGEPAFASNLRGRWTTTCGFDQTETIGFAEFVRQKATLALERAERRVRGARYKVPRLVHEEILGRPSFRGEIQRIAQKFASGARKSRANDPRRSLAALTAQAAADLGEIAATHSPLVIDLVNHAIRWLYSRGYDEKLVYDETMMKRIAGLEEHHPVVFLPSHKSNLDHLVLQYALHEHGLPPNHTAGGINMNFFPVGQLVRRSGVFFIRRTFRKDPVYKHVLAHYIDYLIEKRFPLEWYIEGGRSRSGKLLPPRYGLLANVVDAYRRGKSEDVLLVPVSIAYDQIQDVGSYVAEQRGGDKERESFSWFLRFVRQLNQRSGRISIAFGEPVSLRQQLGDPGSPDAARASVRFDLEKLAFEVSVRINRAIAELALLHAGEGQQSAVVPRFWAEVMRLRDLLKFEFFFPEKEAFRDEIRQELEHTAERWEARLADGSLETEELVRRSRPFSAHRALRPFLESYRVVADQLVRLSPSQDFDEKRFLALCLGVGRQYKLQKRIHAADSISKVLFQTALRLARNRELLREGDAGSTAARLAFAKEIHDVLRRVDIIVALAASRRAGFRARVLPQAGES